MDCCQHSGLKNLEAGTLSQMQGSFHVRVEKASQPLIRNTGLILQYCGKDSKDNMHKCLLAGYCGKIRNQLRMWVADISLPNR